MVANSSVTVVTEKFGKLLSLLEPSYRLLAIGADRDLLQQLESARLCYQIVAIGPDTAYKRATAAGEGEDAWDDSFDCVIAVECLEYIRRPAVLLGAVSRWLTSGGRCVVQVANLRYHTRVLQLLEGRWPLPSGQLRAFTVSELERLLYRCHFEVDQIGCVKAAQYDSWQRQSDRRRVQIGPLHFSGANQQQAEEFFIDSIVISASATKPVDHGNTSIIIVTHNQLPYTRQCLESIRFRTDEPYEIICVDNASSDPTVEYLSRCSDVRLIANDTNRGFPAAVNQGIEAAVGEQVVLLNNDCIVTTGWLRRMLDALKREGSIGIVGPCSNAVSGIQQVVVDYEDLSCLDGFAWRWASHQQGRLLDCGRLVGFCMLIGRGVINQVGLFDERFGIGCFEDDDYCRRALEAGFRTVIAQDAFVHHFGSQTFRNSGVDFASLLEKNQRLYQQKWNAKQGGEANESGSCNTAGYGLELAPGGGLRLVRQALSLSLCMICRDNENTIRPCLESIRPWVDEMVVVDTGSKDKTPQIAEQLGARVFHFPWCDDFSAARNESIKYARGEWIFWMDSDDTIPSECGRKLKQLAASQHDANILGYVAQVHCPADNGNGTQDVTAVDHLKLFRNRPDLRFECRIHEQIIPAIRRAGGEVGWSDIYIVHSGADHTPEGRGRKIQRDLRILEKELREKPDHPFALFNLGMTYADDDQHEKAVPYLRRSLEVSQPSESHVRKVYALLVGSLCQLGRFDEAWEACAEGRSVYREDAELLFREGILHQQFERFGEAETSFLAALNNHEQRHFSSFDQGIVGYKARHNLAITYEKMKDYERAKQQWRTILQERPDYRYGYRGLGELLLKSKRYEQVEELIAKLDRVAGANVTLQGEAKLLRARLNWSQAHNHAAREAFQAAFRTDPEDADFRGEWCRFLFEQGEPTEIIEALTRLIELDPNDASAHHNLGMSCMRVGSFNEAIESFKRSLELRSGSITTRVFLATALRDAGRIFDAILEAEIILRIDPGNSQAQELLHQMDRSERTSTWG